MNRLIIALGLLTLMAACQTMPPPELTTAKDEVRHFVAVWLKDPADQAAKDRIAAQCKAWRNYPGVHSIAYGEALPGERTVIQDYDFGVLITFESVAALRAYEQDPEHQRAIREVLAPAAAKVKVFDFVTPASHSNGVDRAELRKRQLRHYQEFAR